jgi:hypothetical protein
MPFSGDEKVLLLVKRCFDLYCIAWLGSGFLYCMAYFVMGASCYSLRTVEAK